MRTYHCATSLNPWNNHPARAFVHSSKECPLLKHWQGQVMEYQHKPRGRKECLFCSNKKILTRLQKAYRTYLLFKSKVFITSYVPTWKATKPRDSWRRTWRICK